MRGVGRDDMEEDLEIGWICKEGMEIIRFVNLDTLYEEEIGWQWLGEKQ